MVTRKQQIGLLLLLVVLMVYATLRLLDVL